MRTLDLRAGDVLLSRGTGQVSAWMAWNAAAPYSHASLVLSPGWTIDARLPRVEVRMLAAVLDEQARVDVYRPRNRDGTWLDRAQCRTVVEQAASLQGVPFALSRMPALALHTWLRRCMPWFAARCVRRSAPRASALSCAELVYVVLHDACRLRLGTHAMQPQPRPPLAPMRLLRELRAGRRAFRKPVPCVRRSLPPLPRHLIPTHLATSPDIVRLYRLK